MENIGHPQKEIRDQLIYSSFARGISENLFTKEQYSFLVQQSIDRNLIESDLDTHLPATLTRSFTSLLNVLLMYGDSTKESEYYQCLTSVQRNYFFETSLNYLLIEKDYTGYSERYGWVHAFAHGGDYLAQSVSHRLFPKEKMETVWILLVNILKNLPYAFTAGEERRLAAPLYIAIQTSKLESKQLAKWITETTFPTDAETGNILDYDRFRCFQNFLATIYFQLETSEKLSPELKKALMHWLEFYY